jgi:serine/threonine protein kinase
MPGKLLVSPGEKVTEKVRFGNFEVINDSEGRPVLLGKGTFGRTYQARHCYLDTIVALKIITERYVADAAVRQRFLTEARAVAKLSHPHIARLYDFGEMDGVLHYAMEYCGGGSLADYVAKKGPLPLRQTIEIAQQISGALKCAHTAGFIHRDLKPSNIMLTAPDGPMFAKLIDFGLVQASVPGATRSFSDDQSADGARFLGTPLFASPEQLREEPMDVRTDLFSLGMTLWFLMAGRAPESGSSAEIAASRLNRESYAARLPANLPPPFLDVLAQLLEKDRKNRFATAANVFKALNACAAALGFRRARDYTDPAAALEWEDAEVTPSGARDFAKLEPAELEPVEAQLSSEFNIVARINEDFTGINYVADEVGKKGAMSILHVLHPLLLEDEPAFERFRTHIAQLMRVDVAEIVQPKAIKRYSDYVAVISDKPGGTDLLSVLRTERTVPLVEAAPLLEKIAEACDQLCAAGLPGVQLAPGRIFVERPNDGLSKAQARLCPRFLAVSEATELARMNEPEDASSTMTTDMLGDPARADNMTEHFASLLYRVVAGRNCPVAASLSSQAYVAIPGLSEQSNRILAMVIARQVEDSSCGKVLGEVLNAEGIVPRVSGHSLAGSTARPGSSTVSPLATPPTAPVDRTPAAVRSWKPPTVSTPRPKPTVAKPVAPSVPLTPFPTPVEAMLPSSPPTQMPPAPPKEPVPLVSEAKVESQRAIEPPAPIPVSKPPAPEIVSQPAEARAKDAPAAPIQQERQKTVKESEKPAPIVSPRVAKTREEKKAVAKPAVSPPPVEKPTFVTPKVMPAPKVPVTPRRSADVEAEPQFWDGRKLKPVGIGIAALVAISLSYVGVKALTKPPVKPPTITAQPSPAVAPQIVTATENAPPALTNPPSVSEAAQNVAPPTQSPETAALTLTNPATAPGATQNVAPPNQDATGNAGAAPKQDAAEQSTSHTQPGQPQIAAKPEPENPSNASRRTRSGDASTRGASSGQTAAKSSGAGRSTARSSGPTSANAPPPAARTTSRPAPAPKPAAAPKRQGNPFGESAPGG